MKLEIQIGTSLVEDGWGQYWGDYLCAVGPGIFYSTYVCFDVDYMGDGCRLPTKEEIQYFIAEVKKKYPDAEIEDGTGVLAA